MIEMATKLRRCLYIGLGGTGMNALLKTKKIFIDNYGEVPPMIEFLGIDTDSGVYSKSIPSRYGEVTLLPSEQCSLTVDNYKAYFNHLKKAGKLTWMPEENTHPFVDNLNHFHRLVRTDGRLAFVYNAQKVASKIVSALSSINNLASIDNTKYDIIDGDTEVHMTFSLCGGTGSGTFIDTAYLIQSLAPEVKVIGYAVLHGVFSEAIGGMAMQKISSNTLGAIIDLDYLMSLKYSSQEVEFDWNTTTYKTNLRPFAAINIIDNKNSARTIYHNIDDLSDVISLALVAAAGEIGHYGASVADNVIKAISDGIGDIEDKVAWFSTLGASEIIFKGSDIAEVYALKSALKLIQNLCCTTESGEWEAANWIDGPGVNIRENNGINDVTDRILEGIRPQHTLMITPRTAAADATRFLQEYLPSDSKFAAAVDAMTKNVTAKLHEKVENIIQRREGGGLKLAEDMLESIRYNIENIFRSEVRQKLCDLERHMPILKQQLDVACFDLTEYINRLFFWRNTKEEAYKTNEVADAAFACGQNALEIKCREFAIKFYDAILDNVNAHLDRVRKLLSLFDCTNFDMLHKIHAIQNASAHNVFVSNDLPIPNITSIEADDDIQLSDFMDSLGAKSIYSFSTEEAIYDALKSYCMSLPEAQRWSNRTIDDVLNEMSEKELVELARIATHKASPMMEIYDHGYAFDDRTVYRGFYVCAPDKMTNVFTRIDPNDGISLFEKNSHSCNINYVSTGLSDRVIIYRQESTYPAFTIKSLESCYDSYKNGESISFHFDANLYNKMKQEEWRLEPR